MGGIIVTLINELRVGAKHGHGLQLSLAVQSGRSHTPAGRGRLGAPGASLGGNRDRARE